jgi:hypothetical protein
LLRLNPGKATAALERAASARKLPLKLLDIRIPEARALYGRDLVLIRPDAYIAWRGDQAPDDPEALLARISGY